MEVRKRHNPESDLGRGYAHDLYEFEAAGIKYVARSYASEPEDAHFLRKEVAGQMLQLTPEDVQSGTFREAAVAYLREHGKAQVQYLSFTAEGYVDVPF
jgi:hypothetical protein